jgi:PAS domain S-box-containing protein
VCLKRKNQKERSMLHGLVDACFLIDTQGKVLFQNFAAEDAFGYDSSIIGTNIKEITPPETRAKHDTYLRYVEKKAKLVCFVQLVCAFQVVISRLETLM